MVLSVELRDACEAAEARMLGIPENMPATITYENTGETAAGFRDGDNDKVFYLNFKQFSLCASQLMCTFDFDCYVTL
jgi:hypothetical protein